MQRACDASSQRGPKPSSRINLPSTLAVPSAARVHAALIAPASTAAAVLSAMLPLPILATASTAHTIADASMAAASATVAIAVGTTAIVGLAAIVTIAARRARFTTVGIGGGRISSSSGWRAYGGAAGEISGDEMAQRPHDCNDKRGIEGAECQGEEQWCCQ